MTSSVTHRRIDAGAVTVHVAEQGSGAPVILCHGFPELWYSWRHQLAALSGAGYRAVALDMRGYGETSAPADVNAYDSDSIGRDVLAVLDDLGASRAALVGHDWGAVIVWHLARAHPERVAAVAGLSVPFIPAGRSAPLAALRAGFGEDFYIVWFQGKDADDVLSRDVRRTLLTKRIWGPRWAAHDEHVERPEWITEEDERVYVEAFTRTGFTGGLNYYRNLDRNWEISRALGDRRIEQPALFLTGERDPVRRWSPVELMDGWLTDLRQSIVVPGAGHWVQQEAPGPVNDALVGFLRDASY